MVRRYAPLSERQVEVLTWVADGCPERAWSDFSYKRTTYALADRGLVSVGRRRHSWSAHVTEQGRYYLDHGTCSSAQAGAAAPARHERAQRPPRRQDSVDDQARKRAPDLGMTPEQLLAALRAGDRQSTIADPPARVRAAHRSAISRAIAEGLVPDGYVLRHKRRDHGDLVIRLVLRAEAVPACDPRVAAGQLPTNGEQVRAGTRSWTSVHTSRTRQRRRRGIRCGLGRIGNSVVPVAALQDRVPVDRDPATPWPRIREGSAAYPRT